MRAFAEGVCNSRYAKADAYAAIARNNFRYDVEDQGRILESASGSSAPGLGQGK